MTAPRIFRKAPCQSEANLANGLTSEELDGLTTILVSMTPEKRILLLELLTLDRPSYIETLQAMSIRGGQLGFNGWVTSQIDAAASRATMRMETLSKQIKD